MASACVNNAGVPLESFQPSCHSTYGWLTPRVFDPPMTDASIVPGDAELSRRSTDLADFEFCLDEVPSKMLPADELISDGKLVPLCLKALRSSTDPEAGDILLPEQTAKPWICAEGVGSDAFVLSPKAPRCAMRWKELIGLSRLQITKKDSSKAASPLLEANPGTFDPSPVTTKSSSRKSFKHLLNRHLKSLSDPPFSLPMLRNADPEALSATTSRMSLSSSSSSPGPDHEEELLRIPLKPRNAPRMRICKPRQTDPDEHLPSRIVSVDSPRMDPSGRIIFDGLGRSTSSPSSFNGVPKASHRGVERSYSANVRAPSVINVPICSLRGSIKPTSMFWVGPLFLHPRKEKEGSIDCKIVEKDGKKDGSRLRRDQGCL